MSGGLYRGLLAELKRLLTAASYTIQPTVNDYPGVVAKQKDFIFTALVFSAYQWNVIE
jgi:hypothetical protein